MTPRDFIVKVARHYKMKVDLLIGPRRHKSVMSARRTAYWGLRHAFRLSYPEVGQAMSGRDHATVMHSIRRTTTAEQRTALSLFYDVADTKVLAELATMHGRT
jgi:chromosomal replication initiation ATPase DnaA